MYTHIKRRKVRERRGNVLYFKLIFDNEQKLKKKRILLSFNLFFSRPIKVIKFKFLFSEKVCYMLLYE